jgi:hypothetical protein
VLWTQNVTYLLNISLGGRARLSWSRGSEVLQEVGAFLVVAGLVHLVNAQQGRAIPIMVVTLVPHSLRKVCKHLSNAYKVQWVAILATDMLPGGGESMLGTRQKDLWKHSKDGTLGC